MVKLREKFLEELLDLVYIPDTRVVVGPRIGEDAAVIDVSGLRYLIIHSDPITGAYEYLGWLSLVVPANDVAVEGGVPRWAEVTLLFPENTPEDIVRKVFTQIREAAADLGICVIGGHTEYAPDINRPIAMTTCIGHGDRYVPTGGAQPGHLVLMVKSPAIEAALIVASDFREQVLRKGVDESTLRRIELFRKEISLVREALLVRDLASSMHDPTEGGVLEGVYEIAKASGTVIEVWLEEIRIRPEVELVLRAVNVNPLKALSSGTLLLTVPPESLDEAIRRLRRVTDEVYVIGRVVEYTDSPRVIVKTRRDGDIVEIVSEQISDEIMLLWSRLGQTVR